VYLQRATVWNAKGEARIDLPAVDLPVSRTGLLVHYSPRFEVEPKSGAFRPEADPGPWSGALRAATGSGAAAAPAPPPAAPARPGDEAAALGGLMERFRKDMGKTTAGVVPVHVALPEIGPSFFVAAELTAESQAPVLDFTYKRTTRF
jgi:hypothetical protein